MSVTRACLLVGTEEGVLQQTVFFLTGTSEVSTFTDVRLGALALLLHQHFLRWALLDASRAEAARSLEAAPDGGNVQHTHRAAPGLLSSSGTPRPCHTDMSHMFRTVLQTLTILFAGGKLLTPWRRCCLAELTSTTGANLVRRGISLELRFPVLSLRSQQQASKETNSLDIEMQSQLTVSAAQNVAERAFIASRSLIRARMDTMVRLQGSVFKALLASGPAVAHE